MNTILSFDTSADFCSAAIVRDGAALAADALAMSRGHAEALVPLVQKLCVDADIEFAGIDLIGVTVGPGSFTGVRTGIAAAKGFAFAAGCPAVGVSSLRAVAAGVGHEGPLPILVILDTRRTDYFVQLFTCEGAPETPPAVLTADGVRDLIRMHGPVVAGNALQRLMNECDASDFEGVRPLPGAGVPDPVDVARIAEKILNTGGLASETLSPLYLRAPEAKLPPGGGRVKF